jgi:hypothetical protein
VIKYELWLQHLTLVDITKTDYASDELLRIRIMLLNVYRLYFKAFIILIIDDNIIISLHPITAYLCISRCITSPLQDTSKSIKIAKRIYS